MGYPYERFINFLISRRIDVNEALARIELPPVGRMGLVGRREKILSSAPQSLVRYLNQDADDKRLVFRGGILKWAKSLGIEDLWERQVEFGRVVSDDLELAADVFVNPYARTALGALLLAKMDFSSISDVLLEQFSFDMPDSAIDRFCSLFWDIGSVNKRSWGDFTRSLDEDQRSIVALGVEGMDPSEIKYVLGASCESSPKDALQDVLTHAHMQFKRAMSAPDPANSGALKWAEVVNRTAASLAKASALSFEGDDIPDVATNMFSVVMEAPRIISLEDLDGELAQTKTALDTAMEELVSGDS